jgi:hypothetical protein
VSGLPWDRTETELYLDYLPAWYTSRLYQLVTATVVMVVLLAEMTRLYEPRSLELHAAQ